MPSHPARQPFTRIAGFAPALAAACLLASCADRHEPDRPAPLEIMFTSDRDGTMDFFVTDTDTSFIYNLQATDVDEYGAAWSPDGKRFVFTRWIQGNSDVWMIDLNDSTQINLTSSPGNDGGGDFSADGTRIVFASTRADPSGDIYTMRTDGTDIRRLTANDAYETAPRYSPDGRRIAYCRQLPGSADDSEVLVGAIFVMDADGGNPVRISQANRFDCLPSWSPNGRSVVFHGCRSGTCELFEIALGTMTERQLTDDEYDNRWPSYSPDGEWISYTSRHDGQTDIWIMRPDGSEKRQLTTHLGRDEGASWRPVVPPSDE